MLCIQYICFSPWHPFNVVSGWNHESYKTRVYKCQRLLSEFPSFVHASLQKWFMALSVCDADSKSPKNDFYEYVDISKSSECSLILYSVTRTSMWAMQSNKGPLLYSTSGFWSVWLLLKRCKQDENQISLDIACTKILKNIGVATF